MSSSNSIVQQATDIISQYPVYSVNRGMPSREYIKYKINWETFNRIWIYNYTIQTLNKNASASYPQNPPILPDYEFVSEQERISYIQGQDAHISAYPNVSTGTFANNPPINLSSFYGLSTVYGTNFANNLSTTQGLELLRQNLLNYQNNISTLAYLSIIRAVRPLTVSEVSTISTIITPLNVSTIYSLTGITNISTLVYDYYINTIPSTILPVAISSVANFVSSRVIGLTPSTFCSYLVSSLNFPTPTYISTFSLLSSFTGFNNIYKLYPQDFSTYASLSTLRSYNIQYSYFPPSQVALLNSISNTLLYPESRASTYAGLCTLANYSTSSHFTSTAFSTIISLSSIVSLSSIYTSSITTSNASSLFYISTQLSLYNYLSTAILPLGVANASTFATLSTYSFYT